MPKASLIISYYNRTDYLRLVFAALKKQSFRDFEIIIADDGSTEENVKQIFALSVELPFPLVHLWQEDKGFRKNKILNRGVSCSSSDYIIFIDGDCIPHPEFVKEHYANRKKAYCLTGRRVNLSEKLTQALTPEKVADGSPEKDLLNIFVDSISGNTSDAEKGIYTRSSFLRNNFNKKSRGLLGCNFSLHKKDILAVNGFDERYLAPSIGEDSDIQFRLELNGVKIKSLNNIAVQYHLHHKLQPRIQQNLELFEKVKLEKTAYTPFGIKQ
jgi:glycosyltransferase involved in cell wall biosynthesis